MRAEWDLSFTLLMLRTRNVGSVWKEIVKSHTFLSVGLFFLCDKTEHLLNLSCCFFLRLYEKHREILHTTRIIITTAFYENNDEMMRYFMKNEQVKETLIVISFTQKYIQILQYFKRWRFHKRSKYVRLHFKLISFANLSIVLFEIMTICRTYRVGKGCNTH